MQPVLTDPATLHLFLFAFFLVVIAVGTFMLLVGITKPLLRRRADANRALRTYFGRAGFVERRFHRRLFMVGRHDGVQMVAHWFMEQHGLRMTPILVVHAKVPYTPGVKIHAATKLHRMFDGIASFEKLAGWREAGPFMIADGHEASARKEKTLVDELSHDTVERMTDVAAFPYGIALRSGYFTLLYGGATALALAGGDESLAMSVDVEVSMPFTVGSAGVERLLRDLAAISRHIEDDLAA